MQRTPRYVEPPSFRINADVTPEEWREVVETAENDPLGFVHLFVYHEHYLLSVTYDEMGQKSVQLMDYRKIMSSGWPRIEVRDFESDRYPIIPTEA